MSQILRYETGSVVPNILMTDNRPEIAEEVTRERVHGETEEDDKPFRLG